MGQDNGNHFPSATRARWPCRAWRHVSRPAPHPRLAARRAGRVGYHQALRCLAIFAYHRDRELAGRSEPDAWNSAGALRDVAELFRSIAGLRLDPPRPSPLPESRRSD